MNELNCMATCRLGLESVVAAELRGRGLYVETDIVGRGLKAQMKYANKLGAVYSMVLGDDEVNARRARVKRMEDGAETELSLDDLGEFLCQNL